MKINLKKQLIKNNHDAIALNMPGMYYDSYVKLASSRCIFFTENVTKESAAQLCSLLLFYDNEEPGEQISIYISSNGGCAASTSSIIDIFGIVSSPIQTICIGKAFSAAAVILSAGDERIAYKNSKIMIHGIQANFPNFGSSPETAKNYYDFLKDNNDNIMKILAKNTGYDLKELKEISKRDIWLDPTEALNFGSLGVIDGIMQ